MTLNSSLSVFRPSVTVGYIRYQHTVSLKLYDLKMESFFFFIAISTLKNLSIKKKIHSLLFLSLTITGQVMT